MTRELSELHTDVKASWHGIRSEMLGANTSPLVPRDACRFSRGSLPSVSHPITTSYDEELCPFPHLFGNMSARHYGDTDEQQKTTVELPGNEALVEVE